MPTYTYTHPSTGVDIYTREVDEKAGTSRTYWHPSGRVTHERAERFGETAEGQPTYVWSRYDPAATS